MGKQSLRRRLGMGAAFTGAMLAGYGRPVMAGDCAPLGGGTYECSNAANLVTDMTQTLIPGGVLGVTTTMGFGIDTSSNGGHAFYLSADGGLTFTDSFQSLITGANSGIRALNANSGDLVITTSGNVTGLAQAGLYARDNGIGSISITTAGVQGQLRGLDARNFGGGGITIDSSAGSVAGTTDTGLYARNYSSGLVSITAADVSGGDTGIFARTLDGGIVITLTGGMVIGQTTGVYARNDGNGGVTIDSTAGTVTGLGLSITGIYGRDYGTGDLRLTTADVTGGLNGIVARNSGGGDLVIDSTLGTVSADAANSNGIYARDDSAGAVSVTTYDVRGQLRGIDIRNYGGGAVTVDSTLGTVEGIGYTGIYLIDDGTGAVSITTTSVTGGTTGIYANATTGGLAILLAGGEVAGGTTAVHARNDGGDLTIDSTAGVLTGSGMMSTGIFARDFGSGALQITTAEVTAGLNGIYARNAGGGVLAIDTTAGRVEGTANNGVYVLNEVSGAVTITTADVSGGQNGIAANNLASSALMIDTTAGSVDSLNGTGISAYNAIDGLLSLATAGVSGGTRGIFAHNAGDGGTTIDTTLGALLGTSGTGLIARDDGLGSLQITTAGVTGGTSGVVARNYGGGILDIDTTLGTVGGTAANGIYALNDSIGALSISTAQVSGGLFGILARNMGGSALTIDTTAAAVDSSGGTGIDAYSTGGGLLSIATAGVTGATRGVFAHNAGNGGTIVDTTLGALLGTGGTGLAARDDGTGSLQVTTLGVTGGTNGIVARNYGGGDLTVDSSAGTAMGGTGDGLYAMNGAGGGLVDLTTAEVRGGVHGLDARNAGDGGTMIDTVLGVVVGTTGNGIVARDDGLGSLSITTQAVTGGDSGIVARNYGGGSLIIDSTAGMAMGTSGSGLYARNADGGGLSITTAGVQGATGLLAFGSGGGAMMIDTSLGTVTGTGGVGLYAVENSLGAFSVTTADVDGSSSGLAVKNYGGGDLGIDTTLGTITGSGLVGLYARDDGSGALTLTTAAASGGTSGIIANNLGGGDLRVDTTLGLVSGTTNYGIVLRDFGGEGLFLTTAGVTGGIGGIVARNYGGGATEIITTAAAVTGGSGIGVFARDEGLEGFTITTAGVGGGVSGITAQNYGDGDLTIDSTAGSVMGGTAFGIYAVDSSSDLLSITTADVSGGMQGIRVRDIFGGAMTITTHGTVQGAGGAVWVQQLAAGNITLSNDGILRNSAGDAAALTVHIAALTGDTVLVENLADGLLIGQVELTAQDDSLDNAGTWRLGGGTSTFGLGNDWVMNQAGALMLAGLGGAAEVTRLDGLELFENAGRLELRDGGLGDRVEVSGAFTGSGGGLVGLDIFLDDGSTLGDRLVVEGAVGGASVLALNVVGGAGAETGTGPGHGIVLVDASAGSTDDDDFTLLGGPIETGIYSYDLVLETDGIWYLQSSVVPAIHEYPNAVTASFLLADSLNGTLEERLGELRQRPAPGSRGAAGSEDGSGHGLNFWVRSVAEQGDYEPGGAPDFAQTNLGVVGGADVGFSGLFGEDRLFLGVMAGYGHGDARGEASRFAIDGVAFGLYATYLLENGTPSPYDGLYVDLVGRATLLDVAVDSSAPQSSADYDATSWGASIEVGYGVELSRGLILEPQAQLSYSWLQQDDFVDSRGVAVSLDDGESLRGRLGLRLQRHWDLRSLGAAAPYLEFNLLHEFEGTNRIIANGVPFESGAEGTSYQAGFGLDALIGRDISVYGSIKATWGEHVDNAVRAVAGLRLSF